MTAEDTLEFFQKATGKIWTINPQDDNRAAAKQQGISDGINKVCSGLRGGLLKLEINIEGEMDPFSNQRPADHR
jgi:hypothetical protein